ncbi:MAG: flavodoxin domain-containing protein [Thomasclavelia sp.]|jgi:flavorubredoxin/rubredoxin|nr:flavodoxin domain-containing protein [Thomasclavelia sp.]
MEITNDIIYVGVDDHKIDLFEGQYDVPNGMAYNSYLIMDDKIAIMDSVEANYKDEWLNNIEKALGDRKPDYLIIQHMEPDHSANIMNLIDKYNDVTIVGNNKTFKMLNNYFPGNNIKNIKEVNNNDVLDLGKHKLTFVFAPMVHWPEVMVTYDSYSKVLFSADAFGKFGANDVNEDWDCEARRYYFGIVGKYGVQVQTLLKKAKDLDISIICPLHGPVLNKDLDHYLNQYNTWSSYNTESDGVLIAYTSVYGHTKKAVELLKEKLEQNGCKKVVVNDLARYDMAESVEDAFRYGKVVFATTTYNSGIFPFMKEFIDHLVERNFQNKTVAFIENSSWAPMAIKTMKTMLEKSKNITYLDNNVSIVSALKDSDEEKIEALAKELLSCKECETKEETKAGKHHYVCSVCGYVYEGDSLPDDFVCPLCKQGADKFKQID